jgi:hypothetical protein
MSARSSGIVRSRPANPADGTDLEHGPGAHGRADQRDPPHTAVAQRGGDRLDLRRLGADVSNTATA